MSNFTKSIVYSGMVLVAGLIAIFTLYNNMAHTDASGYAGLEPAAGEMSQGVDENNSSIRGFLSDAVTDSTESVNDASMTTEASMDEATDEAADAAIEAAKEELSEEISDDAIEAIEDAKIQAQDAVEGDEAKAMAAEKVEEQSEEMVEQAADEAIEKAAETQPAAGEETETEETAE